MKMKMKKNVGMLDRILRLVVGIAIILVAVINSSWWGLIGAAILIPAALGSDPLYNVIGVDTNKKK